VRICNGKGKSVRQLSLNSTGPTRTPTPTLTSSPTSAREFSRGSRRVRRARKSAQRAVARAARRTILADLSADFRPTRALVLGVLARMSVGKRACTRVRVLYMINYRVHVYKITRWRNPNVGVRVRVGPVGFQLYATSVTTTGTHLPYDRTGCYLPPSRGDNPAFIPAN